MYDNSNYAEKRVQAAQAGEDRVFTPLDRIGEMADHADRIGNKLDQFLDRCRGLKPEASAQGPRPVPNGHIASIEQLADRLERLERLANDLNSIG